MALNDLVDSYFLAGDFCFSDFFGSIFSAFLSYFLSYPLVKWDLVSFTSAFFSSRWCSFFFSYDFSIFFGLNSVFFLGSTLTYSYFECYCLECFSSSFSVFCLFYGSPNYLRSYFLGFNFNSFFGNSSFFFGVLGYSFFYSGWWWALGSIFSSFLGVYFTFSGFFGDFFSSFKIFYSVYFFSTGLFSFFSFLGVCVSFFSCFCSFFSSLSLALASLFF